MHNLKFLRSAKKDIFEIVNFISLDNPYQAKLIISSLSKTIDYLTLFPLLWKELKDWYREIVDKTYKYRIVYMVKDENIYIYSIFKFKNNF